MGNLCERKRTPPHKAEDCLGSPQGSPERPAFAPPFDLHYHTARHFSPSSIIHRAAIIYLESVISSERKQLDIGKLERSDYYQRSAVFCPLPCQPTGIRSADN